MYPTLYLSLPSPYFFLSLSFSFPLLSLSLSFLLSLTPSPFFLSPFTWFHQRFSFIIKVRAAANVKLIEKGRFGVFHFLISNNRLFLDNQKHWEIAVVKHKRVYIWHLPHDANSSSPLLIKDIPLVSTPLLPLSLLYLFSFIFITIIRN